MLNIGDVAVTEIRQQVIRDYHVENWGMIYLASYGRGLWSESTYWAPVGIDEPQPVKNMTAGTLKLTPNPARETVTLSFVNETSGFINAEVYDLTGRLVMTAPLGNCRKGTVTGSLLINNLPTGTYLVKAAGNHAKLVKQ
jgi:hypothetical protein